MASAGDYKWYQRHYQKAIGNLQIAATDTGTKVLIAAALANFTLYVQKIIVSVFTDAAQTLTFQDSNGTPVKIGATKASPGNGALTIDFGPEGVPLTVATELDAVISAAGLACQIHAEGYYRQTGVLKAQSAPTIGIGPTGLN